MLPPAIQQLLADAATKGEAAGKAVARAAKGEAAARAAARAVKAAGEAARPDIPVPPRGAEASGGPGGGDKEEPDKTSAEGRAAEAARRRRRQHLAMFGEVLGPEAVAALGFHEVRRRRVNREVMDYLTVSDLCRL